MPAPDRIKQLVETFEQNLNDYRSNKNETELRRQFLDPFFEALGWDVDNKQGKDERHKEVAHEFSVEIDGQQKKADYAFRIEKDAFDFLVEAKKPSVKVESNPDAAFQIRSYGWSAKIPVNILTDFEHLAIYDCRMRPNYAKDNAKTGRIELIHYKEYIERWDEIAKLFSPDAIRNGALDEYTEGLKSKKGTQEVDDAFLEEIEGWREALAKNIATRNKDKNLNEEQINFAVQMTIDRIIFLRICEERGIEKEKQLFELISPLPSSPKFDNKNFSKKGKDSMSNLGEVPAVGRAEGVGVYEALCQLFQKADDRYNSGLFHFKKDKNRENPDTLSTSLEIDDKVLKDIIKDLYYPSPYAFTYIPTEILGSVYERFLGKVIRLTASGNAKVEEKPEVRKAGGVYYTPSYIVEYIVKNTVGKLLEEQRAVTPDEVSKIKIVDPACGSGSFLLGAYQFLLDWHLDYYASHQTDKWVRNRVILTADNKTHRLSIDEKKRILLNNIHGVDLDPQAVEVTKLSLLLKVVEDPGQLKMFEEGHILPNLNKNIMNGNALIGTDYFSGQMFNDIEEMKRVKPFDWSHEFPEVFKRGGFDVVIGNPPYIRIQAMQEWTSNQVDFYKQKYNAASRGNYDIYVVFIEKALSLLNQNGGLGFILPHKFFNAQYGEPVRNVISKGKHLSKIIHFGDQQVFDGATTYTCLMFLDKKGNDEFEFTKVNDIKSWHTHQTSEASGMIQATNVNANEWNFTVGKGSALFEKLNQIPLKLGDFADIFVGLQTSADDVFIMDLIEEKGDTLRLKSKSLDIEWVFEKELLFPIVSGTDVIRYSDLPERQYVLFPYKIENEKANLIEFNQLQKQFPKTAEYLTLNKKQLEEREKGKMKGVRWHGYIYLKNMTRQATKKLCVPRLVDKLYCAYDIQAIHFLDNVDVGGLTLKNEFEEQGLIYLLGLLNSKLLRWYFPYVSAPFRGGWLSANRQFLSQLPIHAINFNDPAEKSNHDKMVSLVEQMLALHKSLAEVKTPQEKELLQRQITSTDKGIDGLVYELYDLSQEEIGIVEGN